ncbi:DUF2218 domain-containing protein [Roseobacter cerasinus]|nr:DUF2218 domain-containing protein [Roseobacter cerasinus]
MSKLTGTFATPFAAKYMTQLCKHWAHKGAAEWTDTAGSVTLPFGHLSFQATEDRLMATVTLAEGSDATTAKEVMDSHLQRFAFREGFEQMQWADTG